MLYMLRNLVFGENLTGSLISFEYSKDELEIGTFEGDYCCCMDTKTAVLSADGSLFVGQ